MAPSANKKSHHPASFGGKIAGSTWALPWVLAFLILTVNFWLATVCQQEVGSDGGVARNYNSSQQVELRMWMERAQTAEDEIEHLLRSVEDSNEKFGVPTVEATVFHVSPTWIAEDEVVEEGDEETKAEEGMVEEKKEEGGGEQGDGDKDKDDKKEKHGKRKENTEEEGRKLTKEEKAYKAAMWHARWKIKGDNGGMGTEPPDGSIKFPKTWKSNLQKLNLKSWTGGFWQKNHERALPSQSDRHKFKEENQKSHGLKFIHIPRNAGQSIINSAAAKKVKWERTSQKTCPAFIIGYQAAVAKTNLDYVNEIKDDEYARRFCVVRNPLHRFASAVDKVYGETMTKEERIKQMSLLVTKKLWANERMEDCVFVPQHKFIFSPSGVRRCDHILKYEQLGPTFSKLMLKYDLSKIELEPHDMFDSDVKTKDKKRIDYDKDIPHHLHKYIMLFYKRDMEMFYADSKYMEDHYQNGESKEDKNDKAAKDD